MILTDELLVRLADGELDTKTAYDVRLALETDAGAAERYRLVLRSGQTLKDASTPVTGVSGMKTLAAAIRSGDLDMDHADSAEALFRVRPSAAMLSGWRLSSMQMAAGVVLLLSGLFLGYWAASTTANTDATIIAGQPTWIVRVVDYHTLYGRETVAASDADKDDVAALQTRFETVLKSRMHIPNLRSRGLGFKRGQILRFGDVPIIQLAYLPEFKGTPVALCLKPTRKADSKPVYVELRGMGVVRWRQNGLSYVLVGERSEEALMSDARKAQAEITASDTI